MDATVGSLEEHSRAACIEKPLAQADLLLLVAAQRAVMTSPLMSDASALDRERLMAWSFATLRSAAGPSTSHIAQ